MAVPNYQEPLPANNGQPIQQYYNYNPQPGFYRPQYQQPSNYGMIWVQGEAAARAYPIAPATAVILWDSEAEVFYKKSSNAQGKPVSFEIYDYKQREVKKEENQNPTIEALLSEIKALGNRIDDLAKQRDIQQSEMKKQNNQSRKDNRNGQSNV